ncbi:hypothetical protein [Burkholderia cepacia]|uniref:Uncharacterized protein n=1 Tax=Burkholderia cepacia GG4 TaxID=1009846 RepID=A0A9W3K0Q9_BURCE|nr:hypothetical protein [Burkholderia cepacia]AFQ48139.1 hypothetical protein GEM_1714 [Burkholderia cepacia GG4]
MRGTVSLPAAKAADEPPPMQAIIRTATRAGYPESAGAARPCPLSAEACRAAVASSRRMHEPKDRRDDAA